MKPTIESLRELKAQRLTEEDRIYSALSLWICPDCGGEIHIEKGFKLFRKLQCESCGKKFEDVHCYSIGCE